MSQPEALLELAGQIHRESSISINPRPGGRVSTKLFSTRIQSKRHSGAPLSWQCDVLVPRFASLRSQHLSTANSFWCRQSLLLIHSCSDSGHHQQFQSHMYQDEGACNITHRWESSFGSVATSPHHTCTLGSRPGCPLTPTLAHRRASSAARSSAVGAQWVP